MPARCAVQVQFELELELIQTQMTQKPMLRAEVYARALRASQNRKEDSVMSSYVLTSESGGRATHTVIELSFHLESNVALATRNRFPADSHPCSNLIKSLSLGVYPEECGNAPVDYKMPAMVAILTACHCLHRQLLS